MSDEIDIRMSLVEQRYESLDRRMTSVETKIDDLREDMHTGQKNMIKTISTLFAVFATLIITAFGVIVGLIV